MRRMVMVAAVTVLAVALIGSAGCRRVRLADTPSRTSSRVSSETTAVALGQAEVVDATVRMGVGVLRLAAGEASSTTALGATFRYAPADWRPEVTYSVDGTRGVLEVSQPADVSGPNFGKSENTWDLKLTPDVPTYLSMKLGVGESDIDLRNIDVAALEVITGVGEAKIDLSGKRARNLSARIEAGVGEVTITVPRNMGVRVIGGKDGLGALTAAGFSADGNDLVNGAWSSAGPKLDLYLTRGIGDVRVVSVD